MLLPSRALSLCALLVLAACTDKTDDSDTDNGTEPDTTDADTFEEYLVSGVVRGLVNGPVTLEFNGSETLTVAEDGRFSFDGALLDGDAYEVLVSEAPTSQTCTVTAGAGTATTNISDVEVRCECDWQDGLVEVTSYEVPSTVHGYGQIRYLGESGTRGFSSYPSWKQVCGDVNHTVTEAGDPGPSDFGDSATILTVMEGAPAHVNGGASGMVAVSEPGGMRGYSNIALMTAHPPQWTPEVFFASSGTVNDAAIDYVDEFDGNGAGTFAVVAGLASDRRGTGYEALVRATATGLEELHGGDVTIDSVPTCYVSKPLVMPSGDVAAAVYGCDDRARQLEGIALFDATGAASFVLKVGDSVGDDLNIIGLSRPDRDDSGHLFALALTCPSGDTCVRGNDYRTVLRVDANTGTVDVLTDPSLSVIPDRSIVSVSRPKISPGGVFAAVVQTVAADCEGVCALSDPEVLVWDGDWHQAVSEADFGPSTTLRDYDVNDDGDLLLHIEPQFASSAQLLGVLPAPLRCWDATNGLTDAAAYYEDFTAGSLQTVERIDLGEAGHWTASVELSDDRRGIPWYPALVAGTCP